MGNGRLAAMVFGVDKEHLQLNENTLTVGEPDDEYKKVNITKDFDHVVGLLKDKKYVEAEAYVTKNWLGRGQSCYQPMGDLYLDIPAKGRRQASSGGSTSRGPRRHKL